MQHFKTYVIPGLLTADMTFLERFKNEGYAFTFDTELAADLFKKPALFLNGKQDTSVGYKDAWRIYGSISKGHLCGARPSRAQPRG